MAAESIHELIKKEDDEQKLLGQYEVMLTLESDPRSILRIQSNIEDTKQRIFTLQNRIAQLRTGSRPPTPPPIKSEKVVFRANVPYGLESELVGRENEILLLDDWFFNDPDHPFMAIIGLGGIGKSALTWAWLKRLMVDGEAPALVVWWSFYETDGTIENLLATLLSEFKEEPRKFRRLREAVSCCVNHLQRTPTLLVLDGGERLLRAYGSMTAAYQGDGLERELEFRQARQCIDPAAAVFLKWLAQPGLTKSSTLMTSRLFPSELTGPGGTMLAGVRRHDLTGLTPDAAVVLFQKFGIEATRAEVVAVAEPLGYHPLSLRLLAGYAANNPKNPNDLQAAARYDPNSELISHQTHILKQAYDGLPATAKNTLSRLAAFRGGVRWKVFKRVFGGGKPIRNDLQILKNRGLLQQTLQSTTGKKTKIYYDLHPIVRRYAYERLENPSKTHRKLAKYFEKVPEPRRIKSLADLGSKIELYHHLARAGEYEEAWALYFVDFSDDLYFQFGAYHLIIELLQALFPDGNDKFPRLEKKNAQAKALNELALCYYSAGHPGAAVQSYERSIKIHKKRRGKNGKRDLAITLANVAESQVMLGKLAKADTNLRRSIKLCLKIKDRYEAAVAHQNLGRLLTICGGWTAASAEFDKAMKRWKKEEDYQGQGQVWFYRGLALLLQGDLEPGKKETLKMAKESLHFHEKWTHIDDKPAVRDYVNTYWLLGWASLERNDLSEARTNLDEALRRCRSINLVELEPAILLALARLAQVKGAEDEALNLIEEAQLIADRAGYKLHLADIYNFLAQQALDKGDGDTACEYAKQAKDYAWCDGPPYAYQVALDEAERLLAEVEQQHG